MSVENERNFLRHVGGSHVQGDVINGSAFERAPKDIDGLSISIRGVFSRDTDTDLEKIREVVGARRHLAKTSVFAELNVGTTLAVLHEFDETISIEAKPLEAEKDWPEDPSHALLLGLPFKGETVGSLRSELAGDLLARRIIRTFPAVV